MASRPEFDPSPLLRSAREQLGTDPMRTGIDAPVGLGVAQPADQEAFRAQFSPGLRELIAIYAADHPDRPLRFIRYTRSVDDQVTVTLDSGDAPPAEADLVHLTAALSVADAQRLGVVAEVLIAARDQR